MGLLAREFMVPTAIADEKGVFFSEMPLLLSFQGLGILCFNEELWWKVVW